MAEWDVIGQEPVAGTTQAPTTDPWAVVAQHPVSGPSGSLVTDAGRFIGTAGANALGGLLSFPHLPAMGIDWVGGKLGYEPGAEAALSSMRDPTDATKPAFPDFQTSRDAVFNMTGGTEYQPETWLGRRAMDAASAGMMTVGNPSAIPAAMGQGFTGGAAAEMFPEHPFMASFIAGVPGGMLANAAANTAQRVGAAAVNAKPSEPYGAFTRQNLPTDLSGTVTENPGLLWAEKYGSRMPGAETTFKSARGDLLDAWQGRLGQIADTMGTAATPSEVGKVLQSDATGWLTNFKNTTGQLWNDFRAKVPPTTATPVTNYEQTLSDLLGKYPGASESGKVLQPGTLRSLSDALGVDLQGGTSLPWESVQNMRTAIGEKLQNPQTIADTSQAALKRLYGALTDDMKNGAGSVSPEALTAFHKANAITAAGHDLLENYLNPVLKAPSPESAAQWAMSQARLGGDRLGALTWNLPNAAGELGSYALRNAATNTESPTSFSTAMTGRKPIYSPEAQRVLFPDTKTQADIADMAASGRAMMPVEKDLANSPTATHEARGLGRLMTAIEMGRTGGEIAGTPGRIAGFGAGLMAPNLAGRAAQMAVMNPLFNTARFYGREMPLDLMLPSLRNRLLTAAAIGQSQPRP
jgi:hypothetical protein